VSWESNLVSGEVLEGQVAKWWPKAHPSLKVNLVPHGFRTPPNDVGSVIATNLLPGERQDFKVKAYLCICLSFYGRILIPFRPAVFGDPDLYGDEISG
jgi:hypothetical protein